MTLLPSSLLGRNALLIVALVLLGQLGGAWLMRELVLEPRMEQRADALARSVAALRAGLLALPPHERMAFVRAFNERERQRGFREATQEGATQEGATQGDVAPSSLPETVRRPLGLLERRFVRRVSAQLALQGVDASWRRATSGLANAQGGPRGMGQFELRLPLDGDVYWVLLPGMQAVHEFSGAWLIATSASALAALLGALWFQRRMNRPLEQVERAARDIAQGRSPEPLPEDGPREIATVSRSFNQMARSLARAERDRAFMLAGISHDLRTPLTKLRLGVEIAAPRAEPELAASMQRSIEEMDAIVGQFLDFARDEASEAPVPADLREIATSVQAAYADHGKPVRLEGGPLPRVPLRPQAMRRALTNLVENAMRHGRPPVVLRLGSDAHHVWVEVCDAGDGIAPAQAEALKQPFRRAEGARSGGAGAGLGLAIVERVARQHGASLQLLTAETGGLRARLELPR